MDKLAKINDEIEKLTKMKNELSQTKKVSADVFMKCIGREVRADHNKQLGFKEGEQFAQVKEFKREVDIKGVAPHPFTRHARDEGTMTGKVLSEEEMAARINTYEEREAAQQTAHEFAVLEHIVQSLDLGKIDPAKLTAKEKKRRSKI